MNDLSKIEIKKIQSGGPVVINGRIADVLEIYIHKLFKPLD